MKHKRLDLEQFWANEVEVDFRYGDILVAARDENPALDWEVLLRTGDTLRIPTDLYQLRVAPATGDLLSGEAILVRSDGHAHVFRGNGPLDGFDPDWLE